jgi:hypothetical protein
MPQGVEQNAGVAQLVERDLAKVEVRSSSLLTRSRNTKREASWLPFLVGGCSDNAAAARSARVVKLVDTADYSVLF